MARNFITARIPPRVEQKLADHCVKRGVTRGVTPYSLAADLIPRRGTRRVRSDRVRELVRKAFARRRAR